MNEIVLRFVTSDDLVSWAIRRFGNGLFSHVGAMTIVDGHWFELGAHAAVLSSTTGDPGVQLRPADYAKFALEQLVRIPCTDGEYARFWDTLHGAIGKPYADLEIAGIIVGHDFRRRGKFMCSALQHYALTKARTTDPIERARSRLITPDWLFGFTSGLERGRAWLGPRRRPMS